MHFDGYFPLTINIFCQSTKDKIFFLLVGATADADADADAENDRQEDRRRRRRRHWKTNLIFPNFFFFLLAGATADADADADPQVNRTFPPGCPCVGFKRYIPSRIFSRFFSLLLRF